MDYVTTMVNVQIPAINVSLRTTANVFAVTKINLQPYVFYLHVSYSIKCSDMKKLHNSGIVFNLTSIFNIVLILKYIFTSLTRNNVIVWVENHVNQAKIVKSHTNASKEVAVKTLIQVTQVNLCFLNNNKMSNLQSI